MARKKVEPPKEDQAPAYFVMYSALWCILLGFFVMLLSLGKTQMGPGDSGVGEVRDAFGAKGGLGLLPYAKNVLFGEKDGGASSLRIVKSEPKRSFEADSYIRGMLMKKGLSDIALLSVQELQNTQKIVLQLPLRFRRYEQLEYKSVKLLEIFGEIIFNLKDYQFEVMVLNLDDPDLELCQRRAMLKAAVVSRFLAETSGLSPQYFHAVGYCDSRYMQIYGIDDVNDQVLIAIQRRKLD
jgi:hypothetical protein